MSKTHRKTSEVIAFIVDFELCYMPRFRVKRDGTMSVCISLVGMFGSTLCIRMSVFVGFWGILVGLRVAFCSSFVKGLFKKSVACSCVWKVSKYPGFSAYHVTCFMFFGGYFEKLGCLFMYVIFGGWQLDVSM